MLEDCVRTSEEDGQLQIKERHLRRTKQAVFLISDL